MIDHRLAYQHLRRRMPAFLLLQITIAVGVASREIISPIPYWLKELGDVLWPMAAYWLIRLIWPRGRWQGIAAIALAAAWASELSQLSDVPWLAAGRKMPILKMLLGSGFSWIDMGMYVVGVALAVLLDRTFFHAGAERYAAPPRIRAGADYRSGPA